MISIYVLIDKVKSNKIFKKSNN